MSIYTDCSHAVRELAETPEPFTEIDVVLRASSNKKWNKTTLKQAMKSANQIVGQQYRASKLVRFGPVNFKGELDYARMASKIVYAGVQVEGDEKLPVVKKWETPNGTFPALFLGDDTIGRTGRRMGNNRDDQQPWDEQEVEQTGVEDEPEARQPGSGPEVANNPVKVLSDKLREREATIELLRRELEAARAAISDHDSAEESRIRQIAGEAALDLVADLESTVNARLEALSGRLERLEEIEDGYRRVHTRTLAAV